MSTFILAMRQRKADPPPVGPAVGDFYNGGYYAGDIMDGGVRYRLIVAPRTTVDASGARNTQAFNGAMSRTNGPANTDALRGSGYSAMCTAIRNLTINGYNDWYLPAADELQIVGAAFKPVTGANATGAGRPGGGNQGQNDNSVPPSSGNTVTSPGQTTIPLFQSGGAQALTAGVYWSSTGLSTDLAVGMIENLSNLSQGTSTGSTGRSYRPIRREAV